MLRTCRVNEIYRGILYFVMATVAKMLSQSDNKQKLAYIPHTLNIKLFILSFNIGRSVNLSSMFTMGGTKLQDSSVNTIDPS